MEMAWIAGTMTVGYDELSDRILLVVEEVVEPRTDEEASRCPRGTGQPPAPAHPGPGGRLHRACTGAGGRRPTAVPALRPTDRPRGPCLPPTQLTRRGADEIETRLRTGEIEVLGPDAVELERHVPGGGPSAGSRLHRVRSERTDRRARTPRAGSVRPSTSRTAASDRSGTSPTASTSGRSRRTSWPARSGWELIPLTILRDGPARHRLAATLRRGRLRAALLHALRGRGRSIPN